MYFGHLSHCTNYVALCVIHMAHCVTKGHPSLSYVCSDLRALFTLVDAHRTRALKSRFSFLPSSSGTPTSALYRAGNLVLSAPHRGSRPGAVLITSQHNYKLNVKTATNINQPGVIPNGHYNTMQVYNNYITTYAETSLTINITTVRTEV